MADQKLIDAISKALQGLDDKELALVGVAVVHGVPIRQLTGDPEVHSQRLIGALRKVRADLTDAGYGIPELKKKV